MDTLSQSKVSENDSTYLHLQLTHCFQKEQWPEMKNPLGPGHPEQIVSILKISLFSERLSGKLIFNSCETKLVRFKQVKMWGKDESEIRNIAVTSLTSY